MFSFYFFKTMCATNEFCWHEKRGSGKTDLENVLRHFEALRYQYNYDFYHLEDKEVEKDKYTIILANDDRMIYLFQHGRLVLKRKNIKQ